MTKRHCLHCHRIFPNQTSLTRHLHHSKHCLYVWNKQRRRLHNISRIDEDQVSTPSFQDPLLAQLDFWNGISYGGGTAADESLTNAEEGPNIEMDASPLCEETEPEVDPEAPIKYHIPGVYLESLYRTRVHAFGKSYYEELRDIQIKNGLSPLFPFATRDDFEVAKFIHNAGLTVNNTEELLKCSFVSIDTTVEN